VFNTYLTKRDIAESDFVFVRPCEKVLVKALGLEEWAIDKELAAL
jgi:hypothetical protein